MSRKKRRGPSLKNSRFIKRGLTSHEQGIVKRTLSEIKARWDALFARNKWTSNE